MKIHIGSQVMHAPDQAIPHKNHGVGTVVDEWGSWNSCRRCYAPIGTCSCGDPVYIGVCGRGTFEVEFEDGERIPINKAWLRKVNVKELVEA